MLNAAIEAGLSLPHSCRAGNCGSCKALLISGDVALDEFDDSALTLTQQAGGQILLCRSKAQSDIEIDIEEFTQNLSAAKFWPARINELKLLCHDVMQMSVELAPASNIKPIAGQYMDFVLDNSRQRSYSIASHNQTQKLDFHIRKVESGLFTERVFSHYQVGDIVRLYGPLGTFFLRQKNSQSIIMLAGGTGFAPIKAMLEQLSDNPHPPSTKLYWGVRRLKDVYLKFWLEKFAQQNNWFSFTVVLSHADDYYTGRIGYVHQAVLQDHADLSEYQIYASGPPAMIKAAQEDFPSAGLNPALLYFDSFDFSVDTLAKINQQKNRS